MSTLIGMFFVYNFLAATRIVVVHSEPPCHTMLSHSFIKTFQNPANFTSLYTLSFATHYLFPCTPTPNVAERRESKMGRAEVKKQDYL